MTPGSEIELNLQSLTKTRTAGDPDDDQIIYTDLTPTRLEQELAAMQTPVSDDLIRQWMDEQKLRLLRDLLRFAREETHEMQLAVDDADHS